MSRGCLYALMFAERENHEAILAEFVGPVASRLRESPSLDAFFFARYNVPSWQVRFRIFGDPSWLEGSVRALVEQHLAHLQERRLTSGHELAPYEPETARYGGEEGVALAERIFFHDTVACLDLMQAERNGLAGKSRREFSLLFADRFLDLMLFDRSRKLDYYSFSYRWAIEDGTWKEEDLRILDERYRALRPGLMDLLSGSGKRDSSVWGGSVPERIATECLEASRPVVEKVLDGIAAGRIRQDPIALAWSYTHMHCNRLGIDPVPEAILRYFMHRCLLEDGSA